MNNEQEISVKTKTGYLKATVIDEDNEHPAIYAYFCPYKGDEREFYYGTDFMIDDFSCSAGEYDREMQITMTFDENELYAFEKAVGHRIDDEEELYRELRNMIELQCDIAADAEREVIE